MKIRILLILLMIITTPISVSARNSIDRYSINDALANERAKVILGDRVKFFFGNQFTGKAKKSYGVFKTNKKTNAFMKSDKEACEWVFITAMKSLKQRAVRQGGNAVINIKSNYRNTEISLNEQFTCGAGAIMAGTSLKGEIVRLK